jgi:glycosyltransferase involved in cell wall biosynthesis
MLAALSVLFISKRVRLLVHWHSDVINKGILGLILRPLEYMLLVRSDVIVATSQVYADSSNALKLFKKKINIIPIWVPYQKHEGEGPLLPTILEAQIGSKKIVLAVGRLVHYKGFNVIIQAAQLLAKNSVIVIVGSGPLERELKKAIDRAGVNDRVVMTGRLSNEALHSLFKRASLFCLPSISRAEAFGVVLLEAMTYSLPIVAFDIPGSGVPWVNQHGVTGFNVPVGNAKALVDACNLILSCQDLRSRLSSAARQRYLAEFSELVSVQRMMLVYERLLGDSAGID